MNNNKATAKRMVAAFLADDNEDGYLTISQVAEKWISLILAANATDSAKTELIAKVRAAAIKAIGTKYGIGNLEVTVSRKYEFNVGLSVLKGVINA